MADAPPLQRLIADTCLREDGEARLAEFAALADEHGVAPEDAAALAGAAPRLAIYRRLVQGNLRSVARQMMPRTSALLGDVFERTVDRFLEEVGPRTHYLRDVPHELFAWAAPRWREDARVPAWAADLAAWELAHFAVSAAPRRAAIAPTELALDRGVLIDDATELLRLDWAVHAEGDAPERRAVELAVYRDAEHAIRVLELTPLAAALVRRLVAKEALGDATRAACDDAGYAPTPDVLASIATLLADLGERGLLLGGAP